MKILMLLDENWNDIIHPNNNMTNWFLDMKDVEIYTVTGGPGLPSNQCCKNYFRLTDSEMLKSIFFGKRAGRIIIYEDYPCESKSADTRTEEIVYNNRKKLGLPILRLIRSMIWRFGRYDKAELGKFIKEFNPDIVFSQRLGSVKMCRMEKIVSELTDAPIVAYTGDDEYSLKRVYWSPFSWIHRFWTRAWIRKSSKMYKTFYTMSERQMDELAKNLNVKTDFLVKCGIFREDKIHKTVSSPIRIVYGGKLYCNRWKTLGIIADALRDINADGVKAELHIYTADALNKRMNRLLNDGESSIVHGRVSAEELSKVYDASDIALHVESFDLKNRLATKYSFSTKVIDCLSSGCAMMVVAWEKHSAYEYLNRRGIALNASSAAEVRLVLESVCARPEIITEYAERECEYGKENLAREVVQEKIRCDFSKIIEECK